MWEKMNQSMLGNNDREEGEEGFFDEESEGLCTSLSATQRMYAFGGCLLVGMACMLLSMIVFAKPIKFAILFTFGNLLAVGSTAFLFGPAQQLRMMFDTVRIYATAIYLGCVVLALICALVKDPYSLRLKSNRRTDHDVKPVDVFPHFGIPMKYSRDKYRSGKHDLPFHQVKVVSHFDNSYMDKNNTDCLHDCSTAQNSQNSSTL